MHYCNDVWKCKPVSVKIVSVFLRLQHYFHAIPDSEGVFRFIKSYGESSPLPQLTIRKTSFNLKCQQLFEELDVTAFCDNIIPSLPITSIFVLIDQRSKQWTTVCCVSKKCVKPGRKYLIDESNADYPWTVFIRVGVISKPHVSTPKSFTFVLKSTMNTKKWYLKVNNHPLIGFLVL